MTQTELTLVLILLAALTLLPLLPSFFLFKLLPSEAQATGPLKGLKVKLGGAFAGYVVVLLLLWGVASPYLKKSGYQIWKVSGSVAFNPATVRPNPNDVVCYIRPPELHLQNDNSFEFELPLHELSSGRLEFPKLIFDLHGYDPVTVHVLQPGDKPPFGVKAFTQTVEKKSRNVRINEPIVLQQSP